MCHHGVACIYHLSTCPLCAANYWYFLVSTVFISAVLSPPVKSFPTVPSLSYYPSVSLTLTPSTSLSPTSTPTHPPIPTTNSTYQISPLVDHLLSSVSKRGIEEIGKEDNGFPFRLGTSHIPCRSPHTRATAKSPELIPWYTFLNSPRKCKLNLPGSREIIRRITTQHEKTRKRYTSLGRIRNRSSPRA